MAVGKAVGVSVNVPAAVATVVQAEAISCGSQPGDQRVCKTTAGPRFGGEKGVCEPLVKSTNKDTIDGRKESEEGKRSRDGGMKSNGSEGEEENEGITFRARAPIGACKIFAATVTVT